MTRTERPLLRATLTTAALVLLGVALLCLGTAGPSGVPLTDLRSIDDWWAAHDPLDAAAGIARQVCLLLLAYLVILCAVRVLSLRRGWSGVARGTTRLLPRVAVVMTTTLLATTTAAGAARSPVHAQPSPSPSTTGTGARMELVTPSVPASTSTTAVPTSTMPATAAAPSSTTAPSTTVSPSTPSSADPPSPTAPLRRPSIVTTTAGPATPPRPPAPTQIVRHDGVDVDVPSRDALAAPSSAATLDPSAALPRTSLPWAGAVSTADEPKTVDAEPAVADDGQHDTDGSDPASSHVPPTYVVRPGDHLWSIAEGVVTGARGGATEAEIAAYWARLIDTNRHLLVDPDEPDLILAGQEFELPAV